MFNALKPFLNLTTLDCKCACGGMLSRAHPIFCKNCWYNKVDDFDVNKYIDEEEMIYVKAELQKIFSSDIPETIHAHEEDVQKDSIEETPITQQLAQNAFAARFRTDFYKDLGKWHLKRSCLNLLRLQDPLKPNTEILEIAYPNLPLERTGAGTFEIRLVSDDANSVVIKRISYATPDVDAMAWAFDSLGEILDRDWGGQ